MTMFKIEQTQKRLHAKRAEVEVLETKLQEDVSAFLKRQPSLRQAAETVGLSVAYLSDICNGRRKVSDAVVVALGVLG